ncbi:MAG TPA: hypothetical protein DCE17_02230 [Lactobacillus sp.]|nr:hypothetical protein [Lactobacillus sp.]
MTFLLKDLQQLVDPNRELKQLVSVGSGAKNRSWLQMQADIFGLSVLEVEQRLGFGVAMLATVGVGLPHLLNVLSILYTMVKYLHHN